jgi:hypothetical protein
MTPHIAARIVVYGVLAIVALSAVLIWTAVTA